MRLLDRMIDLLTSMEDGEESSLEMWFTTFLKAVFTIDSLMQQRLTTLAVLLIACRCRHRVGASAFGLGTATYNFIPKSIDG